MIDAYNFGRIVIDGTTYTRDVIIYPDRIQDQWWRKDGHVLLQTDVEAIVKERPEVLIVGTGKYGVMNVPAQTRRYIESKDIELLIEPTEQACKLYNQIAQKKRTIAALHLTC
ncbi:MAG: Mth938-like domain-containing protein [Candidatus Methanospirareceae archaeon]